MGLRGTKPAREQARTARVGVMFQPSDKVRVIEAAETAGLSTSSWMERVALKALDELPGGAS